MMEPSASTSATPAPAAPTFAATSSPGAGGNGHNSATAPGTAMLRQLSNQFKSQISQVQMPPAIKERTDELERRISATDIARINGYMRLVNIVFASGLWVTCFLRMFQAPSYSHFLVCIYIMFLSAGLVFIENHERFPSVADRIKANFGFMFSAIGKASYILCIAFLAVSQGWIGWILGMSFFFLALFNFFLIHRHPAYKQAMLQSTGGSAISAQQEEADLESMPELRYNQKQAQVPAVGTSSASGAQPSHVSV
ncbi:Golgi apparatus membrane protein TVP15 [Plasmopara halstedii]|uniref:Golgi apparatus membrane protein TVP15 n=1 Tax=Plasmopara halstedii TaxID=4781 RepID=A0A0P1B3G2_PLAHL|nr:Golgi apparatus membrane protein TVP15 [Plasmopara halstedii]CEG48392.1 Golgi apparatus membrane protein TVP15 [Plasmopara halstedii]|eukprot:XP_024584761.1 Golgi apparatus membrane protein TVP15 [Plasmopara halstedii]